jgi:hypothetical protein
LFVSSAHNGALPGTVSAYRDSFGVNRLTSIGSSPYADGQTAPCWVEISHDGKYLFAVNTASGTVSSHSINLDGSLTLVGSFAIDGGGADIDARLSPDGETTCSWTVPACTSYPPSRSTVESSPNCPARRPRSRPGWPLPPGSSTSSDA